LNFNFKKLRITRHKLSHIISKGNAMTIYFASDHAGMSLRQTLLSYVTQAGHGVFDFGRFFYLVENKWLSK